MAAKPICKVDENELILIVKSKNGPGKPLYQEDLPSVLFNSAPRTILGKKWFDSKVTPGKKESCQVCGKISTMERHEVYSLYKYRENYIIKLEGIMLICKDCHQRIHGKFSSKLNLRYGFTRLPTPVSSAMDSNKYPWNKAKYLYVDGFLYNL